MKSSNSLKLFSITSHFHIFSSSGATTDLLETSYWHKRMETNSLKTMTVATEITELYTFLQTSLRYIIPLYCHPLKCPAFKSRGFRKL